MSFVLFTDSSSNITPDLAAPVSYTHLDVYKRHHYGSVMDYFEIFLTRMVLCLSLIHIGA